MNEIEIEQINNVVGTIHNIARKAPQLLSMVLTDEILKYCIIDLDEKMKVFLDYCLNNAANMKDNSIEQQRRNFNATLLSLNKKELEEYFKMYIEYEKIRQKRNIDINWTVDIISVDNVLGIKEPKPTNTNIKR